MQSSLLPGTGGNGVSLGASRGQSEGGGGGGGGGGFGVSSGMEGFLS